MLGGFAAAQANLGPSGQIQVKGVLGPTYGGTSVSTYTKGDLLCGTGTNTVGKLAVGPNTDILVADSTQTCGFKWATPPSGSVSSIATTSPITGGTITSTGTIACATCVVASSPGAGVAHFAGSTQTVTGSAVVGSDMTNNTVTSTQLAVVNTRRTCMLTVGDGTNTVASGDYSPFKVGRCYVPYAATIVEVLLQSDAGTPSVQLQKRNGASTVTDILSGALAAAGTTKTCAKTSTSATCIDGTTSSGSITISTTALAAGDYVEVKSGTASTEKNMTIAVTWTVN
jgi:hypothetical protein